jgi:phosphoribosyl 1,2-cyclic phosphodiesterase
MMIFAPYASGSTGNLYTLSDGATSLIIECGLPYKEMARLLPKAPSEYDACIISHEHGDHCNRRTVSELRKRGLLVESGTYFSPARNVVTIQIKSFEVQHDITNHGYIFRGHYGETCVFLIDCFYSPIVPRFSPTIIAIEANWARDLMQPGDSINDRLFASHMSIDQCIETLKSWDLSKTREIVLLHLSDSRSDEARFVREVQQAIGVPTTAAPAYRRAGR